VQVVIVKTQEEIAEKAHTTVLSSQNKGTGNQCLNVDLLTWYSVEF